MPRDFLTGLVGRAFEQVPVLEKRRASLFEPEAGERLRGEWNESVEAMPSREYRLPPAMRLDGEPREVRLPQPIRARQPLDEDGHVEPVTVVPRQPLVTPIRQADREEARLGPIRREPLPAREQNAAPTRVERVTERHMVTRQTVMDRHETRVERVHDTRPFQESSAPQPMRPRAPRQEEGPRANTPSPANQGGLPQPPHFNPRERVAPPAAPRSQLRARPVPAVAPLPALPTIQVTIGRLELRNAPPPPAPKAAASPARAPRLELDAYMRQREGGKP